MDNYLIERDTLAKVVDSLLATKYPNQPESELSKVREENLKKLDDRISSAIFGKLNDEALDEINSMLDRKENDPTAFRIFFKNAGVDLEQTITDTVKSFSQEFLGGQNA